MLTYFHAQMERRKALIGIAGLIGGAVLTYSGFRWFKFTSSPALSSLVQQKKLMVALVDIIIPKTDSPSASECMVHEYVIKMIIECSDAKTQNNFLSGLEAVERYSQTEYGKSLPECGVGEKNKIMQFMANQDKRANGSVGKVQKKMFGKSFHESLRENTVVGYFTSEQGATQALRYSLVPSKYEACIPYQPTEKAWATF